MRKYAIVQDAKCVCITKCKSYQTIVRVTNAAYNKDGTHTVLCVDITDLDTAVATERVAVGQYYVDRVWYKDAERLHLIGEEREE